MSTTWYAPRPYCFASFSSLLPHCQDCFVFYRGPNRNEVRRSSFAFRFPLHFGGGFLDLRFDSPFAYWSGLTKEEKDLICLRSYRLPHGDAGSFDYTRHHVNQKSVTYMCVHRRGANTSVYLNSNGAKQVASLILALYLFREHIADSVLF